jgi:hypothetical protein
VPGRKTDVNDATWLADLVAHGLIRGSFVPDQQTQEMRNLLRTRKQLVRERSSHIQRLQKTLEDANIKLDSVISDIVGLSGRRMIEALIGGETDPAALAGLAHRRIKASSAELESALRGRVTDHHRFMLRLLVQHIDAIDAAISQIDQGGRCSARALSHRGPTVDDHSRHQRVECLRHPGRNRPRHGPLGDRRTPDLVGRPVPEERRECRQATVHPDAQKPALAKAGERPGSRPLSSSTPGPPPARKPAISRPSFIAYAPDAGQKRRLAPLPLRS